MSVHALFLQLDSHDLTPLACKCECMRVVQPLREITEDTCLFHYLVPPPMSPSAKSVGTPSESGSQDSGDGGTGPR